MSTERLLAPKRRARTMPFSVKNALYGTLLRAVLRPSLTIRPVLALAAISCVALARRRVLRSSFIKAAALALLCSSAGRALVELLHPQSRARWRRRRSAELRLREASTLAEWEAARAALDADAARKRRPREPEAPLATADDPASISEFSLGCSLLQQVRSGSLRGVPGEESDIHDMFTALRAGLAAVATNASASADEAQADEDTAKVLGVCRALTLDTPSIAGFAPSDRARMLDETLTICGRPALLLSGGGILGAAHVGVVEVLHKAGMLPHVLAGSSAGAIVAGVVCTRTCAELTTFLAEWPHAGPLPELFESFFVRDRMRNLFSSGALYPATDLRTNLRRVFGDVTFRQAYERSQRVLNVSVSAARWGERPRLLNFLSAPNCCVWSAVAASCAFPFLYAPSPLIAIDRRGRFVDLSAPVAPGGSSVATVGGCGGATMAPRQWRDGSVEADLPATSIRQLLHTSVTISSQVSPYIIVFLKTLHLLMPVGFASFLADEVRHWALQGKIVTTALQEMLGSRSLQVVWDAFALFGQELEGDVTVLHDKLTVLQILSAASNPSRQDLELLFLSGQRATWAQLRRLRRALAPTQALADAASELRRQARRSLPAQATHPWILRGAGPPVGESAFTRRHGQSVPSFDLMVVTDVEGATEEPGVLLAATPRHGTGQTSSV